jgi:hypothetical protein
MILRRERARPLGRPSRAPSLSLRSRNHRIGLSECRAGTRLALENLEGTDKVFGDIKAIFRKGCLESCQGLRFK